ncbi:hypothetical protein MT418_005815 [Batrachochytrium dendrobatidis]
MMQEPDNFDYIINQINLIGSDVQTDMGSEISPTSINGLNSPAFELIDTKSSELMVGMHHRPTSSQDGASSRMWTHSYATGANSPGDTSSSGLASPTTARSMGAFGLRQAQGYSGNSRIPSQSPKSTAHLRQVTVGEYSAAVHSQPVVIVVAGHDVDTGIKSDRIHNHQTELHSEIEAVRHDSDAWISPNPISTPSPDSITTHDQPSSFNLAPVPQSTLIQSHESSPTLMHAQSTDSTNTNSALSTDQGKTGTTGKSYFWRNLFSSGSKSKSPHISDSVDAVRSNGITRESIDSSVSSQSTGSTINANIAKTPQHSSILDHSHEGATIQQRRVRGASGLRLLTKSPVPIESPSENTNDDHKEFVSMHVQNANHPVISTSNTPDVHLSNHNHSSSTVDDCNHASTKVVHTDLLPTISPMTPFDDSFAMLNAFGDMHDSANALDSDEPCSSGTAAISFTDHTIQSDTIAVVPNVIDNIKMVSSVPQVINIDVNESKDEIKTSESIDSNQEVHVSRRHTTNTLNSQRQSWSSPSAAVATRLIRQPQYKGSLDISILAHRKHTDSKLTEPTPTYTNADYYGCVYGMLPKYLNDAIIRRDLIRAQKWNGMSHSAKSLSSITGSTTKKLEVSMDDNGANIDMIHKFSLHRKFATRLVKGVPQIWRGQVWLELFSQRSGMYDFQNPSGFSKKATNLLNLYHGSQLLLIDKEILFDAAHTMRYHISFSTHNNSNIKILAKIAQIIVQLLPDFGYRKIVLTWIALLLTVTNEENAFLIAMSILEKPSDGALGTFYSMYPAYLDKPRMQTESCQQYTCLLEKCLPKVAHHLKSHSIEPKQYVPVWIDSLFVHCFDPLRRISRSSASSQAGGSWNGPLPLQSLLRLWDLYGLYGYPFLICAAVGMIKMYETVILRMGSVELNLFILECIGDPASIAFSNRFITFTDSDKFIQGCLSIWQVWLKTHKNSGTNNGPNQSLDERGSWGSRLSNNRPHKQPKGIFKTNRMRTLSPAGRNID